MAITLSNRQRSFIATNRDQIKVWKTIKDIIPIVLSVAEKYDGKVINKRFFDAVNAKINNPDILIGKAQYNSEHRIQVNCYGLDLRYSQAGGAYIDECSFTIYPDNSKTQEYIDNDKRFHLDIFKESIEFTLKLINERIDAMQDSLDDFERYMQEIADLEKLVNERIDKMPYPIRPRVVFNKKV